MKQTTQTEINGISSFRVGVSAFWSGQKYVYGQHPKLLMFGAVPMLLGALILVGFGVLFFMHIDSLISWLWIKPESTGVGGWMWQAVWYVFSAVTIILSAATAVLLSFLIFMILCAPFNDLLSEQVEALEGTFVARPFEIGFVLKDAWHSIVLELFKVSQRLLWLGPLYVLSLVVPVVGQLLYMGLGGYKMSFWLGMEYVDWALARRGYSAQERVTFSKQHRWPLLGFGLMLVLGSLIPFGAVVLWPGAVAGGTLLCTGLTPQDRRQEGISPTSESDVGAKD